ncbi:hypothetical protein S225a_07310 [Candidatus Brocadiaceae bacterium S225]|nr:hypothetical protein S225a_07310 [Candidatus Brocadiaceae bacterium S225]
MKPIKFAGGAADYTVITVKAQIGCCKDKDVFLIYPVFLYKHFYPD